MFDYFHHASKLYSGMVALRVGRDGITYSELASSAAAAGVEILGSLPGKKLDRPYRIGLLGSSSAAVYIAYLGALRVGCTIVPLNTEHPHRRNAEIIRLAELDLIVHPESEHEHAVSLNLRTGVPLLSVFDDGSDFRGGWGGSSPEPAATNPDQAAYLIFTSGSTGSPKGVPVSHRNITAWLSQVGGRFIDGPGARVAQTSELSWDMSVYNMFLAWISGGELVILPRAEVLTPVRSIVEHDITHWHSTPSSITTSLLLGELKADAMPDLRWSLFGGEALRADHVRAWNRAAPNSRITNVYGQTETTISTFDHSFVPITARERGLAEEIEIGIPHSGVEWRVVDENGALSELGELILRGRQRFGGYLNPRDNLGRFARWEGGSLRDLGVDESLTTEHWYRTGDRVEIKGGDVYFRGRVDHQVKVMGHRVELEGIESALRAHPLVDDAVVVPCETREGITVLVGFYCGSKVIDEALVGLLAERFSRHMVPRSLVRLEKLPLNTNQKIDRRLLKSEGATVIGGIP